MPHKSYLIACGVLKPDVAAVVAESDIVLDTLYLEGGLHSEPPELRRRAQAAIDAVSGQDYQFIVLGYGMCGRGTVGLVARDIPLLIPKVHDCISLFLGSDEQYREEFRKFPGTYYISAGWYEEKVQPKGTKCACKPRARDDARRSELAAKYGEENADAIVEFLTSWRRNYQRAAFIDTGVKGKKRYDSYARAMAEEFGWRYERLEGRHDLLEKLFDVQQRHPEILVVPPNHVTVYDAKRQQIAAAAPSSRGRSNPSPASSEPAAESSVLSQTPSARVPGPDRNRSDAHHGRHVGLGIDAGGTYTDAVIFDYDSKDVLCKGKALTTRWDYSVGITRAVDQLDDALFPNVELVAISTTLATNAIVEGHGQSVGLILIPSQFHNPAEISHSPTAVVKGRIDISGRELEPLDPEEVRLTVRRMVDDHGVKAFAVSGYGASVNPAHELAVKRIIQEETGLATCLGSELSELLNFCVRANTAVLNARILPLLARFMEDVERALAARSVSAPVMVVRGDGSLMTDAFAAMHPVETVMSGPAASVAGARYLTKLPNALVVDVGGTTSDIARVQSGQVKVRDAGSRVGKWRTHVRAVDMRTEGIGGDSEVALEKRLLTVGPRRVEPVSLLAVEHDVRPALDYLAAHLDDFAESSAAMTLVAATNRSPSFALTDSERRVWERVSERPYSLKELSQAVGAGHWSLIRTARLADSFSIAYSGLTPSDLLHACATISLWDDGAARRISSLFADLVGVSVDELLEMVFDAMTSSLVTGIIEKQFEADATGSGLGKVMINNILSRGNRDIEISARLPYPLVGLGAAAPFILERPGKVFDAELIVPRHAEVANAVGAITSLVSVKKSVSVVISDTGTYLVHGVPGAPEHESFEAACKYAERALEAEVLQLAREAGTREDTVEIQIDDRLSETSDGAEVFLERRIVGSVTGAPNPT